MRQLAVVVLSIVLLASVANAQPKAQVAEPAKPVDMSKPAPEMAQLKFLTYAWKCTGRGKDDAGKDANFTATLSTRSDLGGFWNAITYTRPKSGTLGAFVGKAFAGYDRSNSAFVLAGADDHGGWITLASKGWDQGQTAIVFEGPAAMGPQKSQLRFTFSKGATDKQLGFRIEAQMNNQWVIVADEACKR